MANKESWFKKVLAVLNEWVWKPLCAGWAKFFSIFNSLNKMALLFVALFFGYQWHIANISLVHTASFSLTAFVAFVLHRDVRNDKKNNTVGQPEGKNKK